MSVDLYVCPLQILMLIKEVEGKRVKEFYDFTRSLYKNDPEFISHIDSDIEALFNSKTNSALSEGNAKRWLLYNDKDEVIGKIAAFHSSRLKLAGIGFFDCIDNLSAASLLFETAENWLKSEGHTHIEAPINFGERDKYWGLLVDGFKNPSYQENYNYPYYQRLFELNGYTKQIEQTTSETKPEYIGKEQFKSIPKDISDKYRFEHIKLNKLDRYLTDFVEVYNKAWSSHDFFVPVTHKKIKRLFKSMRPIIREDLIWFAYSGNTPVSFYVSIIDVNQIFKKLNGKMDWWAKLKFLYYKRRIKVDRIRGIAFGIVPEHQGKGIYTGMVTKMYQVFEKDPYLRSTELSWIGDFNPKMHALFAKVGAVKTKTHFTYEKHL